MGENEIVVAEVEYVFKCGRFMLFVLCVRRILLSGSILHGAQGPHRLAA